MNSYSVNRSGKFSMTKEKKTFIIYFIEVRSDKCITCPGGKYYDV